jgi:hypothetical protein
MVGLPFVFALLGAAAGTVLRLLANARLPISGQGD